MYNHQDAQEALGRAAVDVMDVIDCFVRAIQTLPARKDPIFEPHYKLVSIVHKLVVKGGLEVRSTMDRTGRMCANGLQVSEAHTILEATPYIKKVPQPYDEDTWEPFVLRVLNVLRTADKANWHHRMAARAAHIIYDGSEDELVAAVAARHELTAQIFTKTMHVQVWKPEFER